MGNGAVIPKGLGEDAQSRQEPSHTSVPGWNLMVGHRDGAWSLLFYQDKAICRLEGHRDGAGFLFLTRTE